MFAYPVESEVVEDTEHSLAINMTACEFARYFRSIGYGHYHETYEKIDGRWRIKTSRRSAPGG